MIPASFLPRPSGNCDLHLHVLTRLQEAIALCCAVQEQLAKTLCAFFKGKFIGVLFFYLTYVIYNLNLWNLLRELS